MAAIRISSDEPFNFLERAIRSNLIFISSVHLKVTLAVNFSAIVMPQEKMSGRSSDSEIFPSLSLFIFLDSIAETLPPYAICNKLLEVVPHDFANLSRSSLLLDLI
ncbi:hypothetical protein J560_3732 [Acinetobacter baumannii 855125]|nr:hypothetical protein J560_3732 [Acinetobacter baumannii 855125]